MVVKEARGGEPLALKSDAYSDQLLPELQRPAAPFHGDRPVAIETKVDQQLPDFVGVEPVRGRVGTGWIVIKHGGEKAARLRDGKGQTDGAV